jgi:hypothetical protein
MLSQPTLPGLRSAQIASRRTDLHELRLALFTLACTSGCQLAFPLSGYDDESAARGCDAAFLCEDFEHGIDPSRWSLVLTGDSVVELDDSRAHRGGFALHSLALPPLGPQETFAAQLQHEEPFPVSAHVRMFVYFPPVSQVDLAVAVAMQNANPYEGINLRLNPNRNLAVTNWHADPDLDYVASGPQMPLNEWVCLEWSFETGGNVSVHQNGSLLFTEPSGELAEARWFQIGSLLKSPPPDDEGEVWIDDLIVDTVSIGCER